MPLHIQGRDLYPIGEVLSRVGLSRSTYFRWVKAGRVHDTKYKDRNGRRVFTQEEVEELTKTVQKLEDRDPQVQIAFPEEQHG
jgi:predicted site-specific integrase-resolvase